jgi:hypothetical protein
MGSVFAFPSCRELVSIELFDAGQAGVERFGEGADDLVFGDA